MRTPLAFAAFLVGSLLAYAAYALYQRLPGAGAVFFWGTVTVDARIVVGTIAVIAGLCFVFGIFLVALTDDEA